MRWPEDRSPSRPVARSVLPRQDAVGEARHGFMNEAMSFRPTHSLSAHRPLGSLMRARLKTYPALAGRRMTQNGIASVEPTTPDQIPEGAAAMIL